MKNARSMRKVTMYGILGAFLVNGIALIYPLQLRGCHRDPRPHPAARPGGVRKHKKGRSRQLRPIHHRRMKTTKKDECSYSVSNAIRTLAMVRVAGFEPTASWTRTMRATNCATPGYSIKRSKVSPSHRCLSGKPGQIYGLLTPKRKNYYIGFLAFCQEVLIFFSAARAILPGQPIFDHIPQADRCHRITHQKSHQFQNAPAGNRHLPYLCSIPGFRFHTDTILLRSLQVFLRQKIVGHLPHSCSLLSQTQNTHR